MSEPKLVTPKEWRAMPPAEKSSRVRQWLASDSPPTRRMLALLDDDAAAQQTIVSESERLEKEAVELEALERALEGARLHADDARRLKDAVARMNAAVAASQGRLAALAAEPGVGASAEDLRLIARLDGELRETTAEVAELRKGVAADLARLRSAIEGQT